MWPFRTLQSRINALEDEIVGLKTKIDCWAISTRHTSKIPIGLAEEFVDLKAELAICENRVNRLKALKSGG